VERGNKTPIALVQNRKQRRDLEKKLGTKYKSKDELNNVIDLFNTMNGYRI
jgi:hypothetical protein